MEVRYFVSARRWWAVIDGAKSPTFDTERELVDWVAANGFQWPYSYCASLI